MAEMKKYLDTIALGTLVDQIKAEDAKVLAAAKSHAEGLSANYDTAGTAATKVQELANGAVATNAAGVAENKAAIAKLNGDANTEGSVAKAVADSAAALQDSIDAVDKIADDNAADIEVLEGKVAALEAGTYDDTEVRGLISANADAIDALEETHATDKGTLEAAIAKKADQTALDAVSEVANAAVKQSDYNTKVAALEAADTRIEGLVTAEAERAAEVESDFEERIAKMEVFWDTTEDADGVVNKLKEIQDYIAGDETGAAEMAGNIQSNTQAIAALDAAYKAADAELQGAIDLKADASALEALDGRVEELEGVATTHALKTEVQAVSDALNEYKDAHAGDYTNTQIDAAIKANTDAIANLNDTYATDAELAQAIENEVSRANGAYAAKSLETTVTDLSAVVDTKAAQSDVATLQSDMTQAKKDIDAVEELAAVADAAAKANAEALALKASQADLNAAVTRIGANETAIAANTSAINSFTAITSDEVNALFA